MKAFNSILFVIIVVLGCVYTPYTNAFMVAVPSCSPRTPSVVGSGALKMGLFDAFLPKPKPKKDAGGMDKDVFEGKGKKITIRQEEDNAMWIEEPKKKGK